MFATNAGADPAGTVTAGNVRVTVLTDRLLRIEYGSDGEFEDRPTLAVVNRRFPVVPFKARTEGGALTVDTGAVQLHCADVSRPFSAKRLHAQIGPDDATVTWRYGQLGRRNLGGTVRTLDNWKGNQVAQFVGFSDEGTVIQEWETQTLEPGLLSRDGWVVIDDSASVVLDPWPAPRTEGERKDLYLFAYGSDHRAALRDASQLFGPQPLPPRYAFGYWYSRYYAYTDRELLELTDQIDDYGIPLDVLVIDMDWHLEGWTGYTWDRGFFPDPSETLERLHDKGLHVSLNLHPAEGVASHEDAFETMCEAMGLDPATTECVPFDITDPRYVDAYFRLLHHPEEDRGVDFWWMDWQQGTETPIRGLDPLAWLNHLHWDDQVRRRRDRRPLIFSRWGGLGAGRYPIGFSGDTYAVWESLAFQPGFTATAANVLYGYWSHDIGGHYASAPSPELYARWIQFGAFSPVLRTHGSSEVTQERRLWEYPNPYRRIMIDTIRRRYELVPYVYTECRRGVDNGLSLVRPMYHEHPDVEAAYAATGQYHFGDRMVVAPVVRPADTTDGMAGARVWLPPGEWYDTAHGARIDVAKEGGEWIERRYLLEEVPVFVPAGTVVPGQRDVRRLNTPSYPNLLITAYPGDAGEYDMYEDDGASQGYTRGQSVTIPLRHRTTARRRTVTIGPAEGNYRGWLRQRPVEVRVAGEVPPRAVSVDDRAIPWAAYAADGHWWYDAATATVVVSLASVDLRRGATIALDRATGRARTEGEQLIDGYPGLARRLDHVSQMVRQILQEDRRRVIEPAQAVDRIARDPSTLTAELRRVRQAVEGLDELLAQYVERWKGFESLAPQIGTVNTDLLAAARGIVATTKEQFS